MKNQKQRGVNVIDAVFAMIIASMIAAAVTTSLGNWFNVRALTASQDGANQYAQGLIAKAASVSWDTLGFVPPASEPAPNEMGASCSPTFRASATSAGTTHQTVILASGATPSPDLVQTSVAEVRGKKYCVQMDVTWNDDSNSATPASSYAAKNVSVKMSWDDKGAKRTITVNSTRSPNIGEAVPAGLSEGHDAETSPLQSFVINRADNDGTNGRVCFTASWKATTDTVSVVGSTSIGLSPESFNIPLTSANNGSQKCISTGVSPAYSYYGLKVSDSAGPKFVGTPSYQFAGSRLTKTGNDLSWNTYPSSGTTVYRVMKSATSDFASPVLVKETSDSAYTITPGTAPMWVRVDTVNSNYTVTANSNAVSVDAAPTATPTPTSYVDSQPTITSLTYKCDADTTGALPWKTALTGKETWDDGTVNNYSNAAGSNNKTLLAGKTYKVTFDGTYQAMSSVSSAIRPCLLSVDHWGANSGVVDATYGFYYSQKLASMPDHIPTTITNMSNMLTFATAFNQNINTWDVSNVTNMTGLFNQAAIFNQPLDQWNTSKVTNMSSMFAAANAFNQPLSAWNTANVTNMNSMFYQNTGFNQNIKGWNVAKVTDSGNFRAGAVLSATNSPF